MNPKVKYIVRALKQFVWFFIFLALIVVVVVFITPEYSFENIFKPESEGGMFQDGAFYKIGALFILISAIYPAYSYVRKEVFATGGFAPNRDKIIKVFYDLGYEITAEDDEKVTFRLRSRSARFMKLYEDAVTITKDAESPLIMTGLRKELMRLATRIEFEANIPEEDIHEQPTE